jgi:hypothetical protein
MTATAWNPAEKPYRVLWRGPYQSVGVWASRTETFATEAEARAAAAKPFVSGITEAVVDVAVNPTATRFDGWKQIGYRKRARRTA